jgi:HK97 family phage portal protein
MGVFSEAIERMRTLWALTTLADPAEWLVEAFTGIKTTSGRSVNAETAFRAVAVLACIRILSEGVASMPLSLYRQRPNGDRVLATSHPLHGILHYLPNEDMSSFELLESMMINVLSSRVSLSQVVRNGAGAVQEIIPLPPSSVRIDRDPNQRLRYTYTNDLGREQVFGKGDIWRVNMLSSGTIVGRDMVSLTREAIGLALAAEEQGARLFSNGAQIAGLLEAPNKLDPKTKEELKAEFHKLYSGSGNAFKTALLEGGLKFSKIGLTAQESQYVEARKFQLAEIARAFRVPPVMLGMDDKTTTYASAEQFFLAFSKFTLLPWCRRIEGSIYRDLLTVGERGRYYAKFNMAGLERGDLKSRFDAYRLAIAAGFMNRNEARDLEEWNRADGLDEFLVPLNSGIQLEDGSVENPNDAKQAEPKPAPPAEEDDPSTAARLREFAQASAERAVRREVKELRSALSKGRSAAEAASDCYADFSIWLQKALPVDEAVATMYVEAHRAKLVAAADPVELLNVWECEAADELAELAIGGKQ